MDRRVLFSILCVGLIIVSLRAVGGQAPKPDLAERVVELEARVTELERYLIAESELTVAGVAECQAESDLAEENLRAAKQRFGKGAAMKSELEEQEMATEIARKKLERAQKVATHRADPLEIEILDAEWRVWFAERQCKYTSDGAGKSLIAKAEASTWKAELAKARGEMERIKARQESQRRFISASQAAGQ